MAIDINKERSASKLTSDIKECSKWQYDSKAKTILKNRQILSCILSCAIDELKGKSLDEIAALIENDIEVNIPVEPGKTNTHRTSDIHGLCNEDEADGEGKIVFDVKFHARLADSFTSQVIINIEAQRKSSLSYPLMNRAVFYASRLISSQKKVEFDKDNYGAIKPVYTIWLCMNRPKDSFLYTCLHNQIVRGDCGWEGSQNLINIIFIGLRNIKDSWDESINSVPDMHIALDAMFSSNLTDIERQNILTMCGIDLPNSIKEELSNMSGLGQSFYDEGKEEKTKDIVKKLILRGKDTDEEIAQIVDIPLDQVIAIKEELFVK